MVFITMTKNILLIIFVFLLSNTASANEVHSIDPTSYIMKGSDIYGNSAYSISLEIKRNKKSVSLKSMKVTIYEESIEIDDDDLAEIVDPNVSKILVENDAGIWGSFITVELPFGKKGFFCRKQKYLYISSLGTMSGKGLTASIINPCG